MKSIKREDLQKEYENVVANCSSFFPEKYEIHGTLVECNLGGLQITLDGNGESCVIVRDWSGDMLSICTEPIEIEHGNINHDESITAFFTLGGENYELSEFMKMK